MNITEEKLEKIKELEMELEHYLVLYTKYHKLGWLNIYRPREIVYKHLENLGYLSSSRSLLVKGKDVVEQIDDLAKKEKDKYEEEFEEFWLGWPSTDQCLHFPATGRAMRGNKHDAFIAYKEVREKATKDQLIKARDNQVDALVKDSMRVNQNKLKFLPNPAKWLKQDSWMGWLDITQKTSKRQVNVT